MTTFDHSAPSRRSRWFAAVVLVAALMAGAAPVQATGTEGSSGAESSPAQIVVLGDSYSSGNGAGAYSDRPCMRSDLAYGPVAARQLGAEITMAACGGGVLADLSQPRHLR